jgi:hypothetical protein
MLGDLTMMCVNSNWVGANLRKAAAMPVAKKENRQMLAN